MIARLLRFVIAACVPFLFQCTVHELNQDSFDQFIKDNSIVLAMFYAPWCYWSRMLLPEFAKAAEQLDIHDPPVKLVSVDCTQNFLVAEKYAVTEFPMIRFFTDGTSHEFNGGRTVSEIVNWVNEKIQKDHVLTSKEDLDQFIEHGDIQVIGAFPTGYDKANFVRSSRHFDDVLYADTTDPAIAEHLFTKHNVPRRALPLFAMFTRFPDERVVVYDGDLKDISAFDKWISSHRFPLVAPFNQDNAGRMFRDGRPMCIVVMDDSELSKKALETAKQVAKEFRGDIIFTSSGHQEPHEKRLIELVGAEDDPLPAYRIVTSNPGGHAHWHPALKYKLETNKAAVSSADLGSFVKKFQAGSLTPHFRSEPVPEDDGGPVKVVVGTNFQDIVMNSPKDVFIKFHAPWCGHCRKLEPIYKQLARKLSGVSTLTIAKIDATRNEIKDLRIGGYPTLLFYAADKKAAPVEFTGDREVDAMTSFILENAKFKFNPAELKPAQVATEGGLLDEEL